MSKVQRYQSIALHNGQGFSVGDVFEQGNTIASVESAGKFLILDYHKRRWAISTWIQPFTWRDDWGAAKDEIEKALAKE